MSKIDKLVEAKCIKKNPPKFEVGDTVDVHVRITEGDKTRVQIFNNVVIARRGSGTRETFTVRRIVQGQGVERVFPVHAPNVVDLKIKKHALIRRAKLYFLRDRVGKATRLKERRVDTRKRAAKSGKG